MAFINVAEWTPESVAQWLQGLEDCILPYVNFFLDNQINGCRLLLLSAEELSKLNITKIGHQEIILEGVDMLRHLHYNFNSETLQSLALRLGCKSRALYNQLKNEEIAFNSNANNNAASTTSLANPSHKDSKESNSKNGNKFLSGQSKASSSSKSSSTPNNTNSNSSSSGSSKISTKTLLTVCDILNTAKVFISWIDRYPFEGQDVYRPIRRTMLRLCIELASTTQRDQFVDRPNEIILARCNTLAQVCDRIVQDLHDSLTLQPASLDVALIKKRFYEQLGINVNSSYSGIHTIGTITPYSPTYQCGRIDLGDEIVQVKYRTVVGWQMSKLVELMKEYPTELILTIKKRPRLRATALPQLSSTSLLKNSLQLLPPTSQQMPPLPPPPASHDASANANNSFAHSPQTFRTQHQQPQSMNVDVSNQYMSATQLPPTAQLDKAKATIRRRATISGATAVLEALRNAEASGEPNDLDLNDNSNEIYTTTTSLLQSKALPMPTTPANNSNASLESNVQSSPVPLQRQTSTLATFKNSTVALTASNKSLVAPPCPPPRQNSCLSTRTLSSLSSKQLSSQTPSAAFPGTLRKQGTCLALPARPSLGTRQLSLMSNAMSRPPAAQPIARQSPIRSPVRIPPLNRAVTAVQLLEQNAKFLLSNPNSPLAITRTDNAHSSAVSPMEETGQCKINTGLLLSGWLHTRREHFNVSLNAKARWARKFVLLTSDYMLYTFRTEQSSQADLVLHLPAFKMAPITNPSTHDTKQQHAFKAYNKHVIFLFSSDSVEDQRRWMDSLRQLLSTCAQHRPELLLAAASPDVVCYSETEDEEDEVDDELEMQNYANETTENQTTENVQTAPEDASRQTTEATTASQSNSSEENKENQEQESSKDSQPEVEACARQGETNEDEDEKHNRRMMRLLNRRRQRYQPIEADRLSPILAQNGELSLSELRARLQQRNLSRQATTLTASQQAVAAAISQPMNRRSISCLDNQSVNGLRDRLQRLHQAADAGLALANGGLTRRAGSQNSLHVSATQDDSSVKTSEIDQLSNQMQQQSLNDSSKPPSANCVKVLPSVPPRPPKPTALQMTPSKPTPKVTPSTQSTQSTPVMPSIQPRRSKISDSVNCSMQSLDKEEAHNMMNNTATGQQDKNNNQLISAPCKPSRMPSRDAGFEMRKPQVPQKPEHLQMLGPSAPLNQSASSNSEQVTNSTPQQSQQQPQQQPPSSQQSSQPLYQHSQQHSQQQQQQQQQYHHQQQQQPQPQQPQIHHQQQSFSSIQITQTVIHQKMEAPAPQMMGQSADQYSSQSIHQQKHESQSIFGQQNAEMSMNQTSNEYFMASHQQSSQMMGYQVEELYQYAEQQTYTGPIGMHHGFGASHLNAQNMHGQDEDDEEDEEEEEDEEHLDDEDEDDFDDEELLDDEEEEEEDEIENNLHQSNMFHQHSMQAQPANSGGNRLFGMLDGGAPGLSASFGPMRQQSESDSPVLMGERMGRSTQLSSTNSDLTSYSDQVFLPGGVSNNMGRSDCGMGGLDTGLGGSMNASSNGHGLDNHLSSNESSPGPIEQNHDDFEAQPNAHQIAALNQLAALGQLAESGQLNEAQQAAAVQQYYTALAELQSAEYYRVLHALQQQAIQQQLPPEVQQQIAVQFQQQFQAHFQQQLQIQLQQQLQMQMQAQAQAGSSSSVGDVVNKPQSLHSLQSSATSPCSESISDEGSCGTGAGLFGSAIGGIGSLGHHGSDESLSSSSGSLLSGSKANGASSSHLSSGSKSSSFRLFGSPKMLKKLTTLKHQKEKRTTTTGSQETMVTADGTAAGEEDGNKSNLEGLEAAMESNSLEEIDDSLDSKQARPSSRTGDDVASSAKSNDLESQSSSNQQQQAKLSDSQSPNNDVSSTTISNDFSSFSSSSSPSSSLFSCSTFNLPKTAEQRLLSNLNSNNNHSTIGLAHKSAAVIKSTGSLCNKLFNRSNGNCSTLPQITQVVYKRGRSAANESEANLKRHSVLSDDGQVILIAGPAIDNKEEPIYTEIADLPDDKPQSCRTVQSDSNRLLLSVHSSALVQP